MARQASFRVGRVTVYLRGKVWWLRYHENGRRRQVRGATDKDAARQLAAQVNAQLEMGAPAATSFEPVAISELRRRWLGHHEDVLRSSVATINRYRTATDHLIQFIDKVQPMKCTSRFQPTHAEAFVRYLRNLKVAPNGHANTTKRRLRDKGVKFILEVCRTMFNFAMKRRHLSPYAENPFTAIEIDRIPIDDAKPVTLLSADQEKRFLEACDDWQLPIFATLLLTGMRPGELIHLLLPDDVDFDGGWLHVRNKADLGWRIKTRNERRIPLAPELGNVLRHVIGNRSTGPLFLRRRFNGTVHPLLTGVDRPGLVAELHHRLATDDGQGDEVSRREWEQRMQRRLWTDMGVIKADRLRIEFMRLTRVLGVPGITAPKTLRHMFATRLQDANVDPLIRNQLMGHAPSGTSKGNGALGMTAVYTHTHPETMRRQLISAFQESPTLCVLRVRLAMSRTGI